MELKNIAILGPGGNVGKAIIAELNKDENRFNITGITRQTSSYAAPSNTKVTHKTVDYASFDSLVEAFTGQDAVVNCITGGATQYEPSKRIVDAAIAAGVKFFFADEFTGNMDREDFRKLPESFAGAKIRNREYLESLGREGKIVWTGLSGGPFFDMWLMKGPAGFDVTNRLARIYGSGNASLCWTPLPTIALAAANMIRKPDTIANRSILICPFPQLTQHMILAALEDVLDTKFAVENMDIDKITKHANIAMERGDMAKAGKGLTLSGQFYEGGNPNDFRHLVENEVVGVEMMDLKDAVRDAIEQYGKDCKVVEGMFKIEACEI